MILTRGKPRPGLDGSTVVFAFFVLLLPACVTFAASSLPPGLRASFRPSAAHVALWIAASWCIVLHYLFFRRPVPAVIRTLSVLLAPAIFAFAYLLFHVLLVSPAGLAGKPPLAWAGYSAAATFALIPLMSFARTESWLPKLIVAGVTLVVGVVGLRMTVRPDLPPQSLFHPTAMKHLPDDFSPYFPSLTGPDPAPRSPANH